MTHRCRLSKLVAEHMQLQRSYAVLQQRMMNIDAKSELLSTMVVNKSENISPHGGEATDCKMIDIGVNLTDPMFQGMYRGKQKHESDFAAVLERCWTAGIHSLIITGGSQSESKAALELARGDDRLYCTVGCHPTRCSEFQSDPDGYERELVETIQAGAGKVVAVGECGLDYARLDFCDRETQVRYFIRQLQMAERLKLPLFLHCRDAGDDFSEIMAAYAGRIKGGVVHSFDGTWELAKKLMELGLYIGINGCSLKTKENLHVASKIPSDRLMIETDAPWCEIRPTHAGAEYVTSKPLEFKKAEKFEQGFGVKSRNEPCLLRQVVEVLAAIRHQNEEALIAATFTNTCNLFFPHRSRKEAYFE
eukprot:m.200390 g.200390  ORF g.200390 m.200390 type:complete len:363 (-) comp18791_c0_seq2:95-1183(-)